MARRAGEARRRFEAHAVEHRGDMSRVPAQVRQKHELWSGRFERSWRRLDDPERVAWHVHGIVAGQLSMRETLYQKGSKKGEQHAVLDASFVGQVLSEWPVVDGETVPPEWRQRAWAGVRLLHDVEWHGGRDHPSVCAPHDEDPLVACDPRRRGHRVACSKCGDRWRCTVCWTEGEWHDHGAG